MSRRLSKVAVKPLAFITVSVILLLALSGCASCAKSAEDVELADKDTIISYAKREFGEAEYVSKKTEKNSITYTLKDVEAGFEYEIKSYAAPIGMDGSVFLYQEDRASTFRETYQNYIFSKLDSFLKEKENNFGCDIAPEQMLSNITFAEIEVGESYDENNMISFLNEFSQKIKEIDKRDYFDNAEIKLFSNGTEIGTHYLKNNEYKTAEEENIEYFMNAAEKILDKEVVFLKKKTLSKAEVPGLSDEDIVQVLGSDTNNITCYYFTTTDGEKYFIADVNVYEKDFSSYHFYLKRVS